MDQETSERLVEAMACAIVHRGPDDAGSWVDGEAGIALGFRRLSIVDLTPLGHQPMVSASQRFSMIFNGEIYNYRALAETLAAHGHRFRGHSDTEVLLAGIEEWGFEEMLKRCNGMFAIALWDRQERVLRLARDRAGEKPLYYGWVGNTFLFGSELKALRRHPDFRDEIDRDALTLYLRHNYIPAPYSIYRGICKLQPGTVLTVSGSARAAKPVAYWSLKEVAEEGVRHPLRASDQEAVAQLDELLRDAVDLRMHADVPLGAFLSGGIDSSLIVALMQAQSAQPVRTFTIGFHEEQYNEAEHAKAVARHLGTEHTELYVTPGEAMSVIPRLPTLYDEPFSDSSQIPTFLVSELTRRHVTVSLSGDAGDELFGGYNRYFWGRTIWKRTGWLPGGVRRSIGGGLQKIPPRFWSGLSTASGGVFPRRIGEKLLADRMQQLALILNASRPEEMYRRLVSHWDSPHEVVRGGREAPTALTDPTRWAELGDFTDRMMYLDSISYLPDDILVKVDRATMGVSLEARVPLLDHRVIEFAWRVPLGMKIREGKGKWLLRQVLGRYVPQELFERPKMGFGVPIDHWLRGPLREWAEELLDEGRLEREGFFDPAPIRRRWDEHVSGVQNWAYYLWDIIIFQAWLDEQRRNGRWEHSRDHPAAGAFTGSQR